jgi:hypothetical protein
MIMFGKASVLAEKPIPLHHMGSFEIPTRATGSEETVTGATVYKR